MWNYGYRNLLVQPKKAVKTLVVSKLNRKFAAKL